MYCIPKEIFQPQEFLETLTCGIGKGILNDAVILPCQHVFCRECIENLLSNKQRCPLCNTKASISSITEQPTFNELVNMSLVKCPKCEWTGNYQSYTIHEKKCSPITFECPQGCGLQVVRRLINQHYLECKFRRVRCKDCNKDIYYVELAIHESSCPAKYSPCPKGCGATLSSTEMQLHLNSCTGIKSNCPFAFCGCGFNDRSNPSASNAHKGEAFIEHLTMIGSTISKLMYKTNLIEHLPLTTNHLPKLAETSISVLWSNGSKIIKGTKVGWSVFLSNNTIQENFAIEVRINKLGTDTNSWKVCLGLFTSNLYIPGSWGHYGNGYGYILGNGCKVHVKGQEIYGEPYHERDVITIEHKNNNITFYRNEKSQGVAYAGINGPFYLAVAISHMDHEIEILNAMKLIN